VAKHSIRIIYLGKKGGGLSLLEDFLTNLISQGRSCELWLSSTLNLEDLDLTGSCKVTYLLSPRNSLELMNPRILFKGLINLKQVLSATSVNLNIFLMPSPFDWIYYKVLRAKNQTIVTCIHDLQSHPGEKWPTLDSTLFRLRVSDIVVVFSHHLASELRSKTTKDIFLASLPKKLRLSGRIGSDVESLIQIMQSSELPIVLLIGRQRKYKDVEAFQKLAQDFQSAALFVIAGEGSIEGSINSKVRMINRWLSNREFMQIISKADILFFPYSEASQSGNIPLAMAEKKIVVTTSQPGLTEQLGKYPLKVIYDGNNPRDISIAFAEALAIHAVVDKFNEETLPDHLIPLHEVVGAIELNLKKGECPN
jgi:hypothetical protein